MPLVVVVLIKPVVQPAGACILQPCRLYLVAWLSGSTDGLLSMDGVESISVPT